jgi:hypothetical protein
MARHRPKQPREAGGHKTHKYYHARTQARIFPTKLRPYSKRRCASRSAGQRPRGPGWHQTPRRGRSRVEWWGDRGERLGELLGGGEETHQQIHGEMKMVSPAKTRKGTGRG